MLLPVSLSTWLLGLPHGMMTRVLKRSIKKVKVELADV